MLLSCVTNRFLGDYSPEAEVERVQIYSTQVKKKNTLMTIYLSTSTSISLIICSSKIKK